MPNTNPHTVTLERLEDKYGLARGRAWGNHAFYLGATSEYIDEIRRLAPAQTCGIKVFWGPRPATC